MDRLLQLKQTIAVLLFAFALASYTLSPAVLAVTPPPDGGYPGGNTAEGQTALLHLTTGGFNTAVGFLSLRSDATGSFNTAIGAGALFANTADQNTAIGAGALLGDTTGDLNTAVGGFTLLSNIGGAANTAEGASALKSNIPGNSNTATGTDALSSNDTGGINTAVGVNALANNTAGSGNTAIGDETGFNQTTGSDNVYIGAGTPGVAGESGVCYIASIFGRTSSGGAAVFINSSGKLGTTTSSKRFKEEIKPMDKTSEILFALKPVTFRYKEEIDPQGIPQFGLVAEDVEKVNPDLVVRDKEGKVNTVRYEQINAMLLNEFLKEHKKVEEQQAAIRRLKSNATKQDAMIAELKKDMGVLTAELKEQATQIQRVSAQIEVSRPAARVVASR
jgi:hypothetical protein